MIHVTEHAEERVRERLGLPRKAVAKLAEEAFRSGKQHSDFAGRMKRYLDGVFLEHRTANNLRVYNRHVFVFANETLITAWPVPAFLRKVCQ